MTAYSVGLPKLSKTTTCISVYISVYQYLRRDGG